MKFNELSQELQELWTRGVDHSVFNEEWAKMGGVGICSDKDFHWSDFFFTMPIFKFGCLKRIVRMQNNSVPSVSLARDYHINSMATPEQCAEAGIDYVPFMGWRDIESAPIDQTSVLLSTNYFGTLIGWRREYRIGWEKLPEFFSHEMIDTEGGDGGCNFEPFAAIKWMPLPLV